ncbi:MAG: LysM peptidoglycan-binding domain-containing protein, partial [Halobacteriovoraceae bacterium]|nr:LysM peptidoglycan-binding domain-containing protein [Halobacteriovoraceae bacterium]
DRLHVVSRGENLYDIARIYRSSLANIIQYNRIRNPSRLYPGMKIKIPGKKQVKQLAKAKKPKKNFTSTRLHVVSNGESLYDIARKYQASLADIIEYNRIRNPSKLYPGTKIKIPGLAQKERLAQKKTDDKLKKSIALASATKTTKSVEKSPIKKPELKEEDSEDGKEKKERHPRISLEKYNLALNHKRGDIYQIQVETEETLGHYADWLSIRTQNIRNLNNLRNRSFISFGQKLLLEIPMEKLVVFKEKRNEFHVAIQEDFYSSFKLTGTKTYTVKSGDTLSHIMKTIALPYWLIRKFQNNTDRSLSVAQEMTIPLIEAIAEESALVPKS